MFFCQCRVQYKSSLRNWAGVLASRQTITQYTILPISVRKPKTKKMTPRILKRKWRKNQNWKSFQMFFFQNCEIYQTKRGSTNWMTITKPSVTNISPRFSRSIKQQTPLTFGQNGLGADINSTWAPARRDERLLLPVLAELATEYKLRGPREWGLCTL